MILLCWIIGWILAIVLLGIMAYHIPGVVALLAWTKASALQFMFI